MPPASEAGQATIEPIGRLEITHENAEQGRQIAQSQSPRT